LERNLKEERDNLDVLTKKLFKKEMKKIENKMNQTKDKINKLSEDKSASFVLQGKVEIDNFPEETLKKYG
jgi:hypothetical protein